MSLKSILVHAAPDDRLGAVLEPSLHACQENARLRIRSIQIVAWHVILPFDHPGSLHSLPGPVPAPSVDGLRLEDRIEGRTGPIEDGVRRGRHASRDQRRMARGVRRPGQPDRYPRALCRSRGDGPGGRGGSVERSGASHHGGLDDRPAGADRAPGGALRGCRQARAGVLERKPRSHAGGPDALPILRLADRGHRAGRQSGQGESHGEVPGADMSHYLARHAVRAEPNRTYAESIDFPRAILSRAADLSCDLIVMGAYGHSRTREWIFGGVTRSIMRTMTRPVLISH